MKKLFFCYAQKDQGKIQPIAHELQNLGFLVWMEKSGINAGKMFYTEIARAIAECDFFLLFISSASVKSDSIRRELDVAHKMERNIVPIRFEEVNVPTEWNFQLAGIQWIEYNDPKWMMRLLIAIGSSQSNLETEDGNLVELNHQDKVSNISFCPYCGSQNPEGFTYCMKCGKPLQEMLESDESRGKKTSKLAPVKSRLCLSVFLCHSSADKLTVRKLYRRLSQEKWIDPWLDEEKLLPGERWDTEIRKAVKAADIVIVCISQGSVNKEGYIQKEIRFALDVADEKPEDTIFIIPLKLEECSVPNRLSDWQWVNYYEEGAYKRLLLSLRKRANTLGIPIEK